MAEAFGAPAMLRHRASGAPIAGLAYATAAAMGIPSMLAEDGGAGQYDTATASRMHDGLQNVLRVLDMIPGGVRNMPAPRRFEKFDWVLDFFGQPLEEIKAETKGQILFMVVSPAMSKDGLICGIGVEAA
jgi:predicted deacylase